MNENDIFVNGSIISISIHGISPKLRYLIYQLLNLMNIALYKFRSKFIISFKHLP